LVLVLVKNQQLWTGCGSSFFKNGAKKLDQTRPKGTR
jgi:hypothetical protein